MADTEAKVIGEVCLQALDEGGLAHAAGSTHCAAVKGARSLESKDSRKRACHEGSPCPRGRTHKQQVSAVQVEPWSAPRQAPLAQMLTNGRSPWCLSWRRPPPGHPFSIVEPESPESRHLTKRQRKSARKLLPSEHAAGVKSVPAIDFRAPLHTCVANLKPKGHPLNPTALGGALSLQLTASLRRSTSKEIQDRGQRRQASGSRCVNSAAAVTGDGAGVHDGAQARGAGTGCQTQIGS